MVERNDWSVGIGRWFGVPVRVHILFFLAILVSFAVEFQRLSDSEEIAGSALFYSLVLFGCVLIHELAHVVVSSNLGASTQSITLYPWGGRSEFQLSSDAQQRLLVFGAGIFMNLCLFMLGLLLTVRTGQAEFWELTNPINPPNFEWSRWPVSMVMIVTWVNFMLLLINLIPCFPFDGAELIRVLFVSVNPELGDLKIESTVKAIGQLTGSVFIGIAVLLRNQNAGPIKPVWAVLLAMGIVVFFCARYDFRRRVRELNHGEDWDNEDNLHFDSELVYGHENLEFMAGEDYSQWLVEKRQERERNQAEVDAYVEKEEAAQADEILCKLHERGTGAITDDERRLLERVSARIRLRRQLGNVD